eukprot:s4580_g3.t1
MTDICSANKHGTVSPLHELGGRDAAMVRCAATASSPDQRATQAARADARLAACVSEARCITTPFLGAGVRVSPPLAPELDPLQDLEPWGGEGAVKFQATGSK